MLARQVQAVGRWRRHPLELFLQPAGLAVPRRCASSLSNPYEILGVPRDAGKAEVRAAYLAHVKRVHPDVTGNPAGDSSAFIAIALAYEVLSNPSRRAALDASLTSRHTTASNRGPQGSDDASETAAQGPPIYAPPTHFTPTDEHAERVLGGYPGIARRAAAEAVAREARGQSGGDAGAHARGRRAGPASPGAAVSVSGQPPRLASEKGLWSALSFAHDGPAFTGDACDFPYAFELEVRNDAFASPDLLQLVVGRTHLGGVAGEGAWTNDGSDLLGSAAAAQAATGRRPDGGKPSLETSAYDSLLLTYCGVPMASARLHASSSGSGTYITVYRHEEGGRRGPPLAHILEEEGIPGLYMRRVVACDLVNPHVDWAAATAAAAAAGNATGTKGDRSTGAAPSPSSSAPTSAAPASPPAAAGEEEEGEDTALHRAYRRQRAPPPPGGWGSAAELDAELAAAGVAGSSAPAPARRPPASGGDGSGSTSLRPGRWNSSLPAAVHPGASDSMPTLSLHPRHTYTWEDVYRKVSGGAPPPPPPPTAFATDARGEWQWYAAGADEAAPRVPLDHDPAYVDPALATHTLVAYRTPGVSHVRWFRNADTAVEASATRVVLPPSSLWLWRPRSEDHTRASCSYEIARRKWRDACLHPAVYVLASAVIELEKEGEAARKSAKWAGSPFHDGEAGGADQDGGSSGSGWRSWLGRATSSSSSSSSPAASPAEEPASVSPPSFFSSLFKKRG